VRGEIMRRDSRSGEWIPLSLGPSVKSITELAYSPRGDWVAYATYPEMTLWRSRLDDTHRQQLTFLPMEASWPSWSPDGTKLVIKGRFPGKPWKVYVIGAEGGTPEPLIPGPGSESAADWSPDGRKIVFSGSPFDPESRLKALYLLDLTTKGITKIPGSEGLFAARWSPDGRWLVAHRMDFSRLMLLDVTGGRWEQLSSGVLHFANWSRDSRYVYFERWGEDTGAMRIRISDRTEEKIGSLKGFRRTIGPERCWSGLTPENELLVLRDIGTQEIYALAWDEPDRDRR
jgi:Tol biopolymer transport system component